MCASGGVDNCTLCEEEEAVKVNIVLLEKLTTKKEKGDNNKWTHRAR